jgi:uncharacterized protein YqgV (UPF0045/DUF77 family)
MNLTVEISYYPLDQEFEKPITEFIKAIKLNGKVRTEPGHMSTLIGGEYNDVMAVLTENIKPFMEIYPSVFALRMTNACKTFR